MKVPSLVFVTYILLASCNTIESECSFQYVSTDGKERNVTGCLKDSLEEGEWLIRDSAHNLIQKGSYVQGIRVGLWEYYQNGLPTDTISWKKLEFEPLKVITNIPTSLNETEQGSSFARFDLPDSANKLTVVIAVHDIIDEGIVVDSFYKQGEKEIIEKGWDFSYKRNRISSKGSVYYMNWFKITKEKKKLEILNLYGTASDKKMVEVTTTFSKENAQLARFIFGGIISNLFIEKTRFINPFENIEKNEAL